MEQQTDHIKFSNYLTAMYLCQLISTACQPVALIQPAVPGLYCVKDRQTTGLKINITI